MNQDVDNQIGGYEPERRLAKTDRDNPVVQAVLKGIEQIVAERAGEYEECAIEDSTMRVHSWENGQKVARGMRAKESVTIVGGGKDTNASGDSQACAPTHDIAELQRKAAMADELARALEYALPCVKAIKIDSVRWLIEETLAKYRGQS